MDEVTTPKAIRPSSPPLSSGRVIGGKFELCGVLGEGGTGIVYEAKALDRKQETVALKVIHGHLLHDKQIRGRFIREAKILSRLSGPHLGAIIDFGEVPDPRGNAGASLLYIALPKVDGPALDQLLREQGPLPIDQALDIVLQVCTALSSAHAQGVVHRDLKPANVILKDSRDVVVVDFGMAKILTSAGTGTTGLTAHNMVFGTPEYMAPEQARGDELDARCDVYAVGVMLYELVTGSVPFTGNTPLNVLTAQLIEQPERPTARASDRAISVALEAVVLHTLAKDPRDRYATASALASAITQARKEPGDAGAVRPDRVGDSPIEHAQTLPAPEPVFQRQLPMEAREAPQRYWYVLWGVVILGAIAVGVWAALHS
jgi:serine/threonine-protein kinase